MKVLMKNEKKTFRNILFVIPHLMRDPVFSRLPWILKQVQDDKRLHNRKGFSLIELIVSVTISAILMVGISLFFSSTFRSMFSAQTQAQNTEKQFAINEIIRNKFLNLDDVIDSDSDRIISFTKQNKGLVPFTFIGKSNENKLVFKDLMLFNKMWSDGKGAHFFANSGSGDSGNIGTPLRGSAGGAIKNFSGFAYIGTNYYITVPTQNKIYKCSGGCSPFEIKGFKLKSPTDVTTNGKNILYIADSENGRIIKYDISKPEESKIIARNLKYPTGLAYYQTKNKEKDYERLFFSETLNNKVKVYNISSPKQYSIITVVGDGEDKNCNKITAKFCQLNMPTGLYASKSENALYIADSGNNRILKISDPGKPKKLYFKFNVDKNYALDRVVFENESWKKPGVYNNNPNPDPKLTKPPHRMLIGNDKNYAKKTYSITDRLTTFTNGKCTKNGYSIYINEDNNFLNLKKDDAIVVYDPKNQKKYPLTITSDFNSVSCKEDGGTSSLQKGKIPITGGPEIPPEIISTFKSGWTIYPANPKNTVVQIDPKKSGGTFNLKGGFQKFEIKIYDIFEGLAYTAYHTERVGDGKIGTPEDTIEVVAKNKDGDLNPTIKFPTGVTNVYFANSGAVNAEGNSAIFKIKKDDSEGATQVSGVKLQTISMDFAKFDYTSDFHLASKDSLVFKEYNADDKSDRKILELKITAQIAEGKTQTYTLNTSVPK